MSIIGCIGAMVGHPIENGKGNRQGCCSAFPVIQKIVLSLISSSSTMETASPSVRTWSLEAGPSDPEPCGRGHRKEATYIPGTRAT